MSINLNKKIYRYIIIGFIICVAIVWLLYHQQQQQNEEGFTPKIKSFYNSKLRKARKHLETFVYDTTLYKRGAVPFLRHFSIY
jgi:hypothetical protein